MEPNRKNLLLAASITVALTASSAFAIPHYWDGNNGTTGFGSASGTWAAPTTGTTTAGWTTSSSGATAISGNSITTALADAINFGTDVASNGLGGGSIAVSGTVDALSIKFGSQTTGNIVLSGGTINLAAVSTIQVGAGGTTAHTIASQITGAGTSLTKTGATLTLSGANNYVGATNITGGSLIYLNTGAKSASSTHTFSANTTLGLGVATSGSFFTSTDIDQAFAGGVLTGNLSNVVVDATTRVGIDTSAGSFSYATSVLGSPTRGLSKFGANTLTLQGANTYTGTTVIVAGTLRLENAAAVSSSSAVTVNSGTTLQVAANTASTFSTTGLALVGATISSDAVTAGTAGVTHTVGSAAVSNATQNFTSGANVLAGTSAGIQLGNITNASGSGGSVTFNPTSANLIIAGGYTGLTNAGTNGLILGGGASANSMTGDITLGTRANINVTKSGTSIWTLSGTHGSLGVGSTTTVSGGALITTKLAALPNSGLVTFSGGTLGVQVGGAGWTTGEVETLLTTATKTSGALGIDTTNGDFAQWIIVTNDPASLGPLGLTKLGANTLTLNSANTYTGTTTIDQGTLKLDVDHALTGALTFGFGAGTTSSTGTLDLATTNVNATFGNLNVLTNASVANTISIGTTKTLQINGAVTVGFNDTALPNSISKLTVSGLGTMSIGTVGAATDANVQVGGGLTSNVNNAGVLDVSGLSTFYANLGTGTFRVGSTTNSGGSGGLSPVGSSVILAPASTIRATSLIIASPDNTVAVQQLKLGSGTNVLHANDIFVAGRGPVNTDGRATGQLIFNGASGSLTVRGLAGGTTRANLSVAWGGQNTTNTPTGLFDSIGRTADLLLGTLTVGARTTSIGGSIPNGTFNFDTGTLNVDNLVAGFRDSGLGAIGTVNLSGGTSNFNNTTAAIVLGSNVAVGNAAYVATGKLNISGTANVTVAANAGTSIQLGNAVVLGTATGEVNISGGTLTVAGDIVRGATTGVSAATVKISGGTLNMQGNDIGTLASAINLTAESGILSNVASINGSGGLTKTTAGTLTVSGIITFSGDTTVSAGTLTLSSAASPANANTANDASTVTIAATGATLDLTYAGTDIVDDLFIGASQLAAGVYGKSGSVSPIIGIPQITGNGTLTVRRANAAPVLLPNGDFVSGSTGWTEGGLINFFSYPVSGGNPGGYGIMNALPGQSGYWVGNNNAAISIASLGLTAGNSYIFSQDMRIEGGIGTNIGGLKVEFIPSGTTGEMRIPLIGNGTTWETYNFNILIPVGTTGIKLVPLWGVDSNVGFDNFTVESTPTNPPQVGIPNPGFSIPTASGWERSGPLTGFTYPISGGNPGGFGVMNASNGGWGVFVSNNSVILPLTDLSLTVGQTYDFTQDMKVLSGTNVGGLKVEFYNGTTSIGDTGNVYKPKIGTGSTWETYTFTVSIPPNTTGIKLVPIWGPNSSVGFDNFAIMLAPPAAPPQATIAPATKVNWTPTNMFNSYQPQKSLDNVVYTIIGPAIVGTTVSSVFDADKAPFYRVMESLPGIREAIYNGAFTEEQFLTPTSALGWQPIPGQPTTRLETGGRGDNGPCMRIKVLNVGAASSGSEIQQNTKNAHFVATGNADPGTVTPGQTYNFSFWAKQISSGPSYEQRYKVSFLADGGGVVTDGVFQSFSPAVGGAWTQFTLNGLVVPAGATSAFIQILGVTGAVQGGLGEVLIDDVSLSGPGFGPPTLFATTTAPAVGISWPSTTGKSIKLQSFLNLANWADFGAVVPGNNRIQTVFDAIVDPKKFYRIGELP